MAEQLKGLLRTQMDDPSLSEPYRVLAGGFYNKLIVSEASQAGAQGSEQIPIDPFERQVRLGRMLREGLLENIPDDILLSDVGPYRPDEKEGVSEFWNVTFRDLDSADRRAITMTFGFLMRARDFDGSYTREKDRFRTVGDVRSVPRNVLASYRGIGENALVIIQEAFKRSDPDLES